MYSSWNCLMEVEKKDLATDLVCGMKEKEESKVKPKLWMVEGGRVKGQVEY